MRTTRDFSPPLAYGVADACQRLGVGRTTIYELIKAGELRPVKIGARTLIPEEDLQRVISSRLDAAA